MTARCASAAITLARPDESETADAASRITAPSAGLGGADGMGSGAGSSAATGAAGPEITGAALSPELAHFDDGAPSGGEKATGRSLCIQPAARVAGNSGDVIGCLAAGKGSALVIG